MKIKGMGDFVFIQLNLLESTFMAYTILDSLDLHVDVISTLFQGGLQGTCHLYIRI